jgi:hypothetical protein
LPALQDLLDPLQVYLEGEIYGGVTLAASPVDLADLIPECFHDAQSGLYASLIVPFYYLPITNTIRPFMGPRRQKDMLVFVFSHCERMQEPHVDENFDQEHAYPQP